MLYRLLSHLLDYPTRDFYEHLPEMRALSSAETGLDTEVQATLQEFMRTAQEMSLTELQERYVNTFDMNQDHSMHLTHHTYGDDRGRGPALIELDEHFKGNGYEVNGKRELPDYLPLILEYVSTLDKTEAKWFLGQMKRVLRLLADNLEKANSSYAGLLRLVAAQATLIPQGAEPGTA